ncbi:IS630 family transposase [Streptomyces sp. NPDC051133]|uniref:IS630 family transposase n=1 Tax=Streptomyces sp. NPDC051133 TaxID=3155521 RepID=UPI00341BD026
MAARWTPIVEPCAGGGRDSCKTGSTDCPTNPVPACPALDAQVEVVVRTLEEVPEGATHWSKRELAKRVGISPTSVLRIWRTFGLQPWRTQDFKISPDLLLIDKIRDVVGLYLAPPTNAVVFAVDEKPQIQGLQRTAPVLPMVPGAPERRSFDYVRHGTVDLFAALNTATGKVIGKLSAQHRAVDFRDFLDEIDRQTDPGLAVHVICDSCEDHGVPQRGPELVPCDNWPQLPWSGTLGSGSLRCVLAPAR